MCCLLKRSVECWCNQCVDLILRQAWTWYLHTFICNSFIGGCFELCAVDFDEFILLSLPTSIVMRFCQGISKNWRMDITWCFVDWHCPAIVCLVSVVIDIYKELVHWCLIIWLVDKPRPHPLFLCPKLKWKAF